MSGVSEEEREGGGAGAHVLARARQVLVRLLDQHLHKGRLAVVQVAHNRHVAQKVRVLHEAEHVVLGEGGGRELLGPQALVELLDLDGLHNGLAQRLRVLLLHQHLRLREHLLCIGIILLVLMEHNGAAGRG